MGKKVAKHNKTKHFLPLFFMFIYFKPCRISVGRNQETSHQNQINQYQSFAIGVFNFNEVKSMSDLLIDIKEIIVISRLICTRTRI